MAKVQYVSTRYRGVFDPIALYRMFDEVDDGSGNRFVLIVPDTAGGTCGDRNKWIPLEDMAEPLMPYQGAGENAEVNALLAKLKTLGLMEDDAPVLTVDSLSADETITAGDTPSALSCVISSSDGRTVAYQWYSNTSDSNEGGSAIEGETSSSYAPGAIAEAGSEYYYCVGGLEGETVTSDVITITAESAE